MPHRAMVHDNDPRQAIWDAIGDVSDIEMWGVHVLCAIYKRPEKTKGGIILTHHNLDEDVHQGKVGLVLKLGQMAFDDAGDGRFGPLGVDAGAQVEPGDWVVYRPSNGWSLSVNGYECRMLREEDIRLRIQHPDQIW